MPNPESARPKLCTLDASQMPPPSPLPRGGGIPESEGPVVIRCPSPATFPYLATRWRPGRARRSDRWACCFALIGPYFEEPLQWKVTEDCQVLLMCKAKPRPRLQPCPQAPWGKTCGCPQAPWLSFAPLPATPHPVLV